MIKCNTCDKDIPRGQTYIVHNDKWYCTYCGVPKEELEK